MMNPPLILGSSSVFRQSLLAQLQIPFQTHSPDIDESEKPNETPQQLVERLAIEKAQAVAKHYPNSLVIGSDQVAVHDNQIVGKPHTHERAVEQLTQASGKHIMLYTGLALINTQHNRLQSDVVPFGVHFKTLSEQTIENYLRKEKPYNCAGSVRSEGLGISLIKRFDGDDQSALIGLPLIRLVSMLEQEGYDFYNV